jgi:CDP-diacylglycerol--serine O-phosphatidyltransferase
MKLNWRPILPFLFTVAAMLAGFYSLLAAGGGHYLLAAQMIMLSMILDGMDGHVARLLHGESAFGADLDTFVDMMSFGLAPAFLAYQVALKDFGPWGLVLASAIVVSGASRLARFRVVDPHRGQRGFLGLPITVNAGWLSMAVFITESGILQNRWISLQDGPVATVVWTCVVLFLLLQVSHVRYGKPTRTPVLFISSVMFVTFLFLPMELAVASAFAIGTVLLFYAFVSPFLPRHDDILELDHDLEDEEKKKGGGGARHLHAASPLNLKRAMERGGNVPESSPNGASRSH